VNSCITLLSDKKYFIAVYTLVLSLKFHKVKSYVSILSIDLSDLQIKMLEQFENVTVERTKTVSKRHPVFLKPEAILTAKKFEVTHCSFFDSDCIVTGDISRYLCPTDDCLHASVKSSEEDKSIFSMYFSEKSEQSIPNKILQIWSKDVGEKELPYRSSTVCSNNITMLKKHLPFVERWQTQMDKVLPDQDRGAHDNSSTAYFQVDESVLNSLLFFATDAPTVKETKLSSDSKRYLAHLGPNNPKPWIFWRKDKIRFYPMIVEYFEWAQKKNFLLPNIPWTYKRKYKILVYIGAELHSIFLNFKRLIKYVIQHRS